MISSALCVMQFVKHDDRFTLEAAHTETNEGKRCRFPIIGNCYDACLHSSLELSVQSFRGGGHSPYPEVEPHWTMADVGIRAPDLQTVRISHAFTGRLLFQRSHPRLGTVRVFVLKKWTWEELKQELPEHCTKFNVDLVLHNGPIDTFKCLMSLTEEAVLEVGYVIKELETPSPKICRALTEAISRHQSVLIWRYVCKYKVPKLLRVRRGETTSPLALLLWAPYLVVEDAARCL